MKIQPVKLLPDDEPPIVKPVVVLRSRIKKLFDLHQFFRILNDVSKDDGYQKAEDHRELSSVCLDSMVNNYIEENIYNCGNENIQRAVTKYSSNHRIASNSRCNCFHSKNYDDDGFPVADVDPADAVKGLTRCESDVERNIVAEISKIVDKFKNGNKSKDELRKIVKEELTSVGYNASIRKSSWDKSSSNSAGEYEYIDVIVHEERLIIDIDFKSEFEMARSTGNYRNVIAELPYIFVGKAERLQKIILIVSEEARLSLKEEGMHVPPWRRAEYMKAKWLTTYDVVKETDREVKALAVGETTSFAGGEWKPPEVTRKSCEKVVVTGLAFLLKESP